MAENQTPYAGIEQQIDEKIAEHVAAIALKKITDEQFENMVRRVLNEFNLPEKGGWRKYELTPFESKVMDKFYRIVGDKIDTVLSNENFDNQAEEIAKRIIRNARQASEEYLTKAIAARMCRIETDFQSLESKINANDIVMRVMSQHMSELHGGRSW